jgi:hypothetical protein
MKTPLVSLFPKLGGCSYQLSCHVNVLVLMQSIAYCIPFCKAKMAKGFLTCVFELVMFMFELFS